MGIGYILGSTGWLVVYLVLSWLLVDMLHLQGSAAWIVRSMLASLGMVVYGLVFWFQRKRAAAKSAKAAAAAPGAAGAAAAPAPGSDDIDFLLKEAEHRLTTSVLGRDARLSRLPVVFLAGQTASAKTSTLMHCGIEAELLSGQVWQEGLIVPTRATNVWFARQTAFLEAGGRLVSDPPRWASLIKHVRPGRLRLRWLLLRKQQPPRAVVLCVDLESFLKPGARETMAVVARNLNARLGEIANLLGVNLPVYVLFTRSDRISFFGEYVRNLTAEEVPQVVGATLPVVLGNRVGVYAEEETRRLTDALTALQFSLCDKRPLFLARENDSTKLPGIYEFPREFRKLRTGIVQFLVDVCRPSQLRASAFLRGFYFSGVRPIEVRDSQAQALHAQERRVSAEEATGIFSLKQAMEPVEAPQPSPGSRRIPQWLFLSHLFNDVILADRAALGASGRNVRADFVRRLLFAGGALLALLLSVAFTISYFGNRALERDVTEAARGISAILSGGDELPSIDSLQRLETLRESVETLARYHRDGAPWSLRWGLYTGNDLYPSVRRLYFGRFHALMFGSTQAGILTWLQRLPDGPGPTDEYTPAYNTLRAYLITTSNHDKSTRAFLSPFLYSHWLGSRSLDSDRARLAQQQFDFYSDELIWENPYSSENDAQAVARARHYLAQFAAMERIYQAMLAEASRRNPTVNFNKQFPASAQAVINNRDIAGAFSKDGWIFMEDAIHHASRYLGGEEWVLGPLAAAAVDSDKLAPELTARYHADYVAHWREYLRNSSIVRYASIADAANKLKMLSDNRSPLLELFCLGSVNTNVASEDAKAPFQPLQYMTPPATCMTQFIGDANNPYINALLNLQTSLDAAAHASGPNDPAIGQTQSAAQNALMITGQVANHFQPDPGGNVDQMTQKLMKDPITYVLALLGNVGPSQLNGAGRNFCSAFNGMVNKYPFNSASQSDATLEEVDTILRPPDGLLWSFYENNLKQYLTKVGSQYVAASGSTVHLTPQFVRFFNHAAALSEAFYAGGAKEPHLTYSMRALPSEGLHSMTLRLDGQTLKATGEGGQSAQFTWPGSTHEARLSGSLGGPEFGFESYDGLWAVFRFFGDADRSTPSGSGYAFEWVPRQGQGRQPMTLENGKPLTVRYYLEMSPPIFQKGYLSGYDCVSRVAQ
jgi:type VI secretion system protein ImpL